MKLSATEYLLILQMRNDSSLTLTTAEEDYIKGLRLEGKTSEPLLKAKREKWHTYVNYIQKVKLDAIASGAEGTLISDSTSAYESAKKLKQGLIDLATYQSEIAALNLSDTDTSKLKYMTTTLAAQYQLALASEDTVLTLDGVVLPDLQ